MNLRHRLSLFLLACLWLPGSALHSQTPAQSSPIAAVPSWFTRCAGQNAQCTVYGPARVIYGTSAGDGPQPGGRFLTQVLNSSVSCSDDTFGEPALGSPKACWYGPVEGMAPGRVLSAGGSDYPFYVQNYGLWDGSQRHVIGHYNFDPTLVEAQLRQFYKTGQRNVSLVLWYMPFGTSNTPADWLYAQAFMDSSGGHLSPLLQANLTAVLGLMQQIGFTQVTLRFAPVGSASPVSWGNLWNEASFDNDEAFEFNTRQLVESALAGSSLKRVYDLGIEMAGIPHLPNSDGVTYADGQSPLWTSRLWIDYVNRYGKDDTYGFSMVYVAGALNTAIAEYDRVGIRPNSYALDDYTGTDLWNVYQELVAANDVAKPVVLQEVFYNDSAEAAAIGNALPHFPLTVASVNQWPLNSPTASPSPSTNAVPPSNYGAYGGGTDITGTLVVAPCTLPAGQATCTAQASWATSNAGAATLFVNGVPAPNLPDIATTLSNTANITLGQGPTSLLLVSSAAGPDASLATRIAGPSDLTAGQTILASQTVTARNASVPVIANAGVGGPNLQSIWVTGSNLSSGCSVQLYNANTPGSAPVASLPNVGCGPSNLSFALPDAVSHTLSALTFTVTNPGSPPSSPYSLAIQPIPTLFAAGLGGVGNAAIWVTGQNFTPACSARLYDPANPGAEAVATLNLTCAPYSLSFTVPAGLGGNYRTLNLTVVDSDWQQSAPIPITLH